jgi:hypothetical protein
MKNTVFKFGLFSLATALVVFFLALTLGKGLDFATQEIIGYLSMVISLIFVYFGIKHYRDTENYGKLSFGRALGIGMLISLFAGLGFAIVDYIYTTVINPDFAQEYLAKSLETMEATLSPEEYKTKAEALKKTMTDYGGSGFMAALMFFTVVLIGFVISLLSALILQRK